MILEKLREQGFVLKKDCKNNYTTECPKCSGKLSVNTLNGKFRCFVCAYSGDMNRELGLTGGSPVLTIGEVEKEEEFSGMPSHSPKIADYLASRGIAKPHLSLQLGYSEYLEAVVFPYHNGELEITGCQYKKLNPGDGSRFIAEGKCTKFFVADPELYKTSETVVVVEGEIDALTLAELGINGVSTYGATSKGIVEHLKQFKHTFVMFDQDDKAAINREIRKQEADLARLLGAKVAVCPAKDPNDYLMSQLELGTPLEAIRVVFEAALWHSPLVATAGSLCEDMFKYLDDKELVKGESTRVAELDELLGGGYRLGEITVTHAEAKTGKNTLWHWLMLFLLENNVPLGYCSRELSPDSEVLPNLLSIANKKNAWLTDLNEADKEAMRKQIAKWPLYFAKGYGIIDISEIKEWIMALSQRGVKLFWLDHLHFFLSDPEDHKLASKFMKDLKALAKTENVHIQLIVQPNKMQEGQRLSLNSIKGGAAIGQALDNLITLERIRDPSTGKLTDVMKLKLEVARSKLASPGEMYLRYKKDTTEFEVVDYESEQSDLHDVNNIKMFEELTRVRLSTKESLTTKQ